MAPFLKVGIEEIVIQLPLLLCRISYRSEVVILPEVRPQSEVDVPHLVEAEDRQPHLIAGLTLG